MAKRVVVGLSGGVDSAVTALLLLEQGHQVSGLFMKNWDEDDGTEHCTARQDLADAQQVCDTLGIALRAVNFAADYWERVFEVFLAESAAGRTPNPDILCNQHVKFKAFLDYALDDLGADAIATGHYARVGRRAGGGLTLLKGSDPDKEQSYFLYAMGRRALASTLFPIGHLCKPQVRALARKAGFANHGKKDSTGICFIGERKFAQFLRRYLPVRPGQMLTADGQAVGRHHGLMYYTLGQRQGLGIGGVKDAPDQPWYVLDKRLDDNVLVVGQGHDHPLLLHDTLEAGQLEWLDDPPAAPRRCAAKIRYRQPDQPCWLTPLADGRCAVSFDQPQRAITPGQSVVFYDGEACLGGGVIEARAMVGQRWAGQARV